MTAAESINILSRFLNVRDVPALTQSALQSRFGFPVADVMVLFGGSIMAGGDVLAKAIHEDVAKRYLIVGGAGHTTPVLREKMQPFLPHLDTSAMQEAEIFQCYLQCRYGVQADFLETASTNCGNNITHLLLLLEKEKLPHESMILTQDGSMQRRMGATLRKFAPDTQIIHFSCYEAQVKEDLSYTQAIPGMWDIDHYITLLLGEIARLRDDEQGYGPRGKNFIAHEDIPEQVEEAFRTLNGYYEVRFANPEFAG